MMAKTVSELTFSELTRYKTLTHFYGSDSVEVAVYLESLGPNAKKPRPKGNRKYATHAEANRMSSKFYYERHAEEVKQKQRYRYAKKRFAEKFNSRKTLILIGFEK